MEHPTTINDLPNELLELMFDHLNVDELKHASLVCRRWSDLAFVGPRMDRVALMPTFPWDNDLLQSNRKYRLLELGETEKCSAHVKELFEAFNISSLRIEHFNLSHSSLRSILLELPNLQHLSIYSEPDQKNETIEPLPVMRKLKSLGVKYSIPERLVPWHTIAPFLQGLQMGCRFEAQLEQWTLFSGQLKEIHATFNDETLFKRFCQNTFPHLEELSLILKLPFRITIGEQPCDLFRHNDFFRRTSSLRLVRLDVFHLTKHLIEDITKHNKKLTALEIRNTGYCETGSMESLGQLPELKHLWTVGAADTCYFRGCAALPSLQSLNFRGRRFREKDTLGFLESLCKIAPQLMCLELCSVTLGERCVQYIFSNFSKIIRLQLVWPTELTRHSLSEIDRFPHLLNLELYLFGKDTFFHTIMPQNNVRCLTLHFPFLCDEVQDYDFLRLAEMFPHLDRLNLVIFRKVLHKSTVDSLRKLLPACVIKTYVSPAGKYKNVPTWYRSEMMPVWEKEWLWKMSDVSLM